jgi:uncharacterized tellurite resistance protein B-like protein
MLIGIKKFFDTHLDRASAKGDEMLEHRLKVATVALLLETARADFDVLDDELALIANHARQFFSLSDNETKELVELADEEARNATCYHEFTSLINNSYLPEEKISIVEMMWRVAYADNDLEKYEEALVRKIADLLYVPHSAFISAKLKIMQELGLE